MSNLVHHIYKLMPYAMSLTKNEDRAKDLLQELAVDVFSDLKCFEGHSEDMIGRIINVKLRRTFYRQIKLIKGIDAFEVKEIDNTVQNDAWSRIQRRELQEALLSLTCNKQNTFFRLKLEGYKTKELSKLFSCTPNSINKNVMYARNYLKKQLAA